MSDKLEKYVLVETTDPSYRFVADLVRDFHDELAEARIALVWENEVKEDCDGHLVRGRAKKIGPFEQKFHPHDFAILLNAKVWRELPESAKRALLDHELSHCGTKTDDTTGEVTYYLRKHDLEEFQSVVRRHGLWRAGIESFVNAALKRDQTPLFPAGEKAAAAAVADLVDTVKGMPGIEKVTFSSGGKTVTLTGGGK